MKKQAFFILTLTLISLGSFAQNVDSLFSKYINATGGEDLYSKIESYEVHQTGDDSKVPFESNVAVSVKDKKVLRTRTVLSRNFLYELNGTAANMHIPTGGLNRGNSFQTQKLSDFEKSKLELELSDEFLPFMNYKAKGYRARVIGPKTVNNENTVQVELSKSGFTRNYYFSTKTNLLVQEDLTYSNGDKLIYQHSKYDKVGGIMFPSESIMTEAGKAKNIKTELKINNIPDEEFEVK